MFGKRRMATKATRVKQSTKVPSLWRYEIEIENPDGSTKNAVTYARGMEDALNTVLWAERRTAILNFFNSAPQWAISLAWFVLFGGGFYLFSQLGFDMGFVLTFLSIVAVVGSAVFIINNKINNRSIKTNEDV